MGRWRNLGVLVGVLALLGAGAGQPVAASPVSGALRHEAPGAVAALLPAALRATTATLSTSPSTASSGRSVILSARVTGGSTPTGRVRWYYSKDGGANYTYWSGHDSSLRSGRASRTWISNSPQSAWRWRARYGGDATHKYTWSAPVRVTVASPDVPIRYPAGSSAAWYDGRAFDACSAPSLSRMEAWLASPYRAIAVYVSGSERFCAQPNLTRDWVSAVTAMGWRVIPVHLGKQPYCTLSNKKGRYDDGGAHAVGISEAKDAVAAAKALGILPGSAIYTDVEHYVDSNSTCRRAVLRNVSAWTGELHLNGYLSGAYLNAGSGIPHLSAAFNDASYAVPDAVWMARWDGVASTINWSQVPAAKWAIHQRVKQYRGGHDETWGGYRINIDSDQVDGPVAVVAQPFSVVGISSLTSRTAPSGTALAVRSYKRGSALSVLCQSPGARIGGSRVWDRLADGTWVADRYVSTAGTTGYTDGVPRCSWPGTQTGTTGLNARSGPGLSYGVSGSRMPFGALAWVFCQARGTTIKTTPVWDRLLDGRYVSDFYVRNRSNTTYSSPVPTC